MIKAARYLLLLFFFAGFLSKTFSQKDEQQFQNTCIKIAQAIIDKDVKTINSYINKNTGAYVLYGLGACGGCLHLTKIVPDTSLFSLRDYEDSIPFKFSGLKYESNPIYYTCDADDEKKSYQWNKEGNFIDVSNKHHPVSDEMNFLLKNDLGHTLTPF